jgi:hypothetical protein
MRVLVATRGVSVFSVFSSIIEELLDEGAQVRLLFDRDWSGDSFSDAVNSFAEANENLEVGWLEPGSGVRQRCEFVAREFRSYASYETRGRVHGLYVSRQRRYLNGLFPRKFQRLLERSHLWDLVGKSKLAFRAAGFLDSRIPPNKAIIQDIQSFNPDVVLATPTNLRYATEAGYLKAARHLGIPTVVPVFTWDNLTTKGLIPIIPDRLLVWNKTHEKEAIEVHNIPPANIKIVGSSMFDKWFDSAISPLDRAQFEQDIGLPKDVRYVLYMGSSVNIAGDEGCIAVDLADAMEAKLGPGMNGMKIVVRPHPANEKTFQEISDPRVIVWLRGEDRLPDTPADFSLYLAFLKYADCVVGINTTGMVDAAIHGENVITLNLPRFHGSNAREAEHIKTIASSGIFFDADTLEIAATKIVDAASGERIVDQKLRTDFIEKFVRPRGNNVTAGSVAAKEIINLAHTND